MVPCPSVGEIVFADWGPTINEVEILSPSSASFILDADSCTLRTILSSSSNKIDPGNPKSGNTSLGSIIHDLYDRAARLDFAREEGEWDLNNAMVVFDDFCGEEEQGLENSEINRHLVPLRHAADFDTKRLDACAQAVSIRKKAVSRIRGGEGRPDSNPHRTYGPEVRVWDLRDSPAGELPEEGEFSVRGSIDLVTRDDGRLKVLDYKTGELTGDGGGPKRSYEVQLQMYAILLSMTSEHLNQKSMDAEIGELRHGLTGERIRIPIEKGECEAVLEGALVELQRSNEAIRRDDRTEEVTNLLANPSLENCRYCDYRSGCLSFHGSLSQWMADAGTEVFDVIGEALDEARQEEDGSPYYQMRISDAAENVWAVNGVDSNRFPEVEQVTAGDTVAIFGGKELEVGLGAIGIDRMFLAHKRSHSFYLETKAA